MINLSDPLPHHCRLSPEPLPCDYVAVVLHHHTAVITDFTPSLPHHCIPIIVILATIVIIATIAGAAAVTPACAALLLELLWPGHQCYLGVVQYSLI